MSIELLNVDCMEYMAGLPDKAFDLAIVDPPYGIDAFQKARNTFGRGPQKFKESMGGLKWDVKPESFYFEEIKRVSKNQIVWGGNYFKDLWDNECRCFIVWNKDNPVKNFSSVEMAWTSFDALPKYFYYAWGGLSDGIKGRNKSEKGIHPTQKPIPLYKWILENYAKPDQRILDTHLGSGSSAIAAHYFGVDFVGCEIDKDYYEAACKRFDNETRQLDLLKCA